MSEDQNFRMSQNYDIVPPQEKQAYPIPVDDWGYLREKVKGISDNANLYHTVGSVLFGVSGSAIVTALTLDTKISANLPIIAWAVCAVSFICGGLAFFFGREQRKVQRTCVNDVITHMDLIEKRYKNN